MPDYGETPKITITLEGMKLILRYQQLLGQRAIRATKAKDSI